MTINKKPMTLEDAMLLQAELEQKYKDALDADTTRRDAEATRRQLQAQRFQSELADRLEREQTAATILAALIQRGYGAETDRVPMAARLADALRAELAKGRP